MTVVTLLVFDKDKIFDYLKILKGLSTLNYGIDNSYKEDQKSEAPEKLMIIS